MSEEKIKTRIKLIPAILKLFIGIVSIFLLVIATLFLTKIIQEPTTFGLVSVLMYSFMSFFFMGLGPISISTFSIDNEVLIETTLGLFKKRTDLKEIKCYAMRQAGNRYRTSDQIILNKRNGQTIFIDSFEQKNFKEFRLKVDKLIPYDFKAKPNYWTTFYKVGVIWLSIWIGLMILFIAIGKR